MVKEELSWSLALDRTRLIKKNVSCEIHPRLFRDQNAHGNSKRGNSLDSVILLVLIQSRIEDWPLT